LSVAVVPSELGERLAVAHLESAPELVAIPIAVAILIAVSEVTAAIVGLNLELQTDAAASVELTGAASAFESLAIRVLLPVLGAKLKRDAELRPGRKGHGGGGNCQHRGKH